GMELITAQRLVEGTEDALRKCSRGFGGVKRAADKFVLWANEKLGEKECDLVVSPSLTPRRIRKKKKMPGESAEDEILTAEKGYEVSVHNVILDTVTDKIQSRFSSNAKLCADFAYLDPRHFSSVKANGLPDMALEEVSKCLLKFDSGATGTSLRAELCSLASQWDRLKMAPTEAYTVRTTTEDSEGEDSEEEGETQNVDLENKSCSSCKACA
ncbi:hypothetical protein WMY93_032902, partial [Mugilogobius chulae]